MSGSADPFAEALDLARDAFVRGVLVKIVLAAPVRSEKGTAEDRPKRVTARPVQIKAGRVLQLVYRHERRDVTRNPPLDEGLAALAELAPGSFRHLHLHTTERTLQIEARSKGRVRRSEGPAAHSAPPPEGHDRKKRRSTVLDPRWTSALGLTDARGRPVRGGGDKLRQVERFVEVLDHWLGEAPRPSDGRARWVDLGCGSGALTFATWAYLRQTGFFAATVAGLEIRPALAARIERIAREVGCDGLSFEAGAIAPDRLPEPVDGVLALHACDTATDDALAAGVEAGARFILAAPCCHKEIRPQLAPPAPLAPLLAHGILRTREAEIATDALRAALLEAAGYSARVFEFVSTEHTDKNLVIAAVRRTRPPNAEALPRARALAAFYGIRQQRLAERLGIDLVASS